MWLLSVHSGVASGPCVARRAWVLFGICGVRVGAGAGVARAGKVGLLLVAERVLVKVVISVVLLEFAEWTISVNTKHKVRRKIGDSHGRRCTRRSRPRFRYTSRDESFGTREDSSGPRVWRLRGPSLDNRIGLTAFRHKPSAMASPASCSRSCSRFGFKGMRWVLCWCSQIRIA